MNFIVDNMGGILLLAIFVLLSMLSSANRKYKEESKENWDLVEENNHLKEKFIELREAFECLKGNIKDENKLLVDIAKDFKKGILEDDPIEGVINIVKSYNRECKYFTLEDYKDLDLKKEPHIKI